MIGADKKEIQLSTLPAQITASGKYIITKNLEFQGIGNAIEILVDNVYINLAGYQINGPHLDSSINNCFYSNFNNITIFNGTINGFMYGIKFEPPTPKNKLKHIEIANIEFNHNYFRSIRIDNGYNIKVYDNKINYTGKFKGYPHAFAIGIEIYKGVNVKIYNNTIKETVAIGIGESIGISSSDICLNCKISNNHIENTHVDDYSRSFGIWYRLGNLNIHANHIQNFTYPLVVPDITADFIDIKFKNNLIDGKFCLDSEAMLLFDNKFFINNEVINNNVACQDNSDFFLKKAQLGNSNAAFRFAHTIRTVEELNVKYCWLSKACHAGHEEAIRIMKRDAETYQIPEAEKYYLINYDNQTEVSCETL